MWGAVIGDLAGSIYEFDQFKKTERVCVKDLICSNSFYSDDSILTIAVLDSILNDGDYVSYLKKYANSYSNYKPSFEPYFKSSFSPGFTKWSKGDYIGNSTGNGAMMRISPVGYLFDTEEEVVSNAYLATLPSHNSYEAISSATIVAMIIYLARCGYSKDEIISRLNLKFSFSSFNEFNYTCFSTLDNCLYALFNSNSYVEALKTVISYGGDTDTNASIVGSMAEALYGVDDELILKASKKIPSCFVDLLNKGYSRIKKL